MSLAALLALSSSAYAATFYVAPTGSDSSSGTLEQPWRTIEKAFATMRAGDSTFLRAGTYEEKVSSTCGSQQNRLNWTTSGTATAPITLSGYPGEESRVVVKTLLSLYGDHLVLRDLVVDRNRAYSPFDSACTGATGVSVWGDHATIEGAEIRNAAMSGIYLEDADNVKILRSYIHRNGTHYNLDHGIYYKTGVDGLIANNVVEANWAFGIKLGPGPTRPVAAQNTVVGNGAGGKGSGIIIGGDDVRVATGALVVNNISVGNKEFGIRSYWEAAVGEGNRADRNLIHDNALGASWYPKGGVTETDSILASPNFKDLALGDYRLLAASPAIGMARTTHSYSPDFLRQTRDSAPDLGAIEHLDTAAEPAPASEPKPASEPEPAPDDGGTVAWKLEVTSGKVKGWQAADLRWSKDAASSDSSVVVYRNGAAVTGTANDGAYTDRTGSKGGGTHTYQLCGSAGNCSAKVTVTF